MLQHQVHNLLTNKKPLKYAKIFTVFNHRHSLEFMNSRIHRIYVSKIFE